MVSKQVAKIILDAALGNNYQNLPSVLIDIIFDYYYPAIVDIISSEKNSSEKDLVNDICSFWMLKDNTSVSFKSATLKSLVQEYGVKNEVIFKSIEKYLDLPILYAPIVHIQQNEEVNFSSYCYPNRFGENLRKARKLLPDDAFPNSGETEGEKKERECRFETEMEKRRIFYQENKVILRTKNSIKSLIVAASLIHPDYFTLRELLSSAFKKAEPKQTRKNQIKENEKKVEKV
jgi:hypothetical protein